MAMRPGYVWYSRAWYGPQQIAERADLVDQIMFGIYDPAGGTEGEMAMTWTDLGPPTGVAPALEAFDDAWHLFDGFHELFSRLATWRSSGTMRPEDFADLLDSLGFEDMTPTTQ